MLKSARLSWISPSVWVLSTLAAAPLSGIAAQAPAQAPAPTAAPAPAGNLVMPAAPSIAARNWVLVDFSSGQTLAESGADARIEPASLTKLMTAYVVFQALRDGRLKMTEQVLISELAWRAEGSRTFVQVGTRVPVDVLIKGMMCSRVTMPPSPSPSASAGASPPSYR